MYATGEVKYFKEGGELAGSFQLTKKSKARKISRYEVELTIPEKERSYLFL
jgi:hypothetical protein